LGVTPWNFTEIFDIRYTVLGLLYGIVCVILHLALLVKYWHVTDRQTDRQTHTQQQHRQH